jgi:Putative zinc-finger
MMSAESSGHVADLLPEYGSGQLSAPIAARVRDHLMTCEACAAELRAWQQIAEAELQTATLLPAPSTTLLTSVLAKIEMSSPVAATESTAPEAGVTNFAKGRAALQHLWHVLGAQRRMLRTAVWVASAAGIVFAVLYGVLVPSQEVEQDILAFALPLIAAAGMTFLYGPDNDPALELTLATPTSARSVLFARFALLFGYDTALALLGTFALATLHGGGFWSLAEVWLGPMALLSSLSLTLLLIFGPLAAVGASAALWLSRAIDLKDGLHVHITPASFWQTTPPVLAAALLLFVFALLIAPRLERLPGQEQLFG